MLINLKPHYFQVVSVAHFCCRKELSACNTFNIFKLLIFKKLFSRTMPPPSMSISRSHKESYLVINNRRYKVMLLFVC